MKKTLTSLVVVVGLVAMPAFAESVSYATLEENSNGDATSSKFFGKTVDVKPSKFSQLGFVVPKSDMTFVCKSGDKILTSTKPKAVSFQGTTVSAMGWDGITVWTLANCQPTTGGVAQAAPASGGSDKSGQYTAGNKNWDGTLKISGLSEKPKVAISTASARSMCDIEGIAQFSAPDTAIVKVEGAPSCKMELKFTSLTVKVKSDGCDGYCGAAGPGFDFAYVKK